MTATASGSSSVVAVLNPVNPSIATTSIPSRQDWGRSASQVVNACLKRPSTMSSSRAGPVPSRIPVRSMITVTYLSPRRVCRHDPDAVEPGRVVDHDAPAFGQHRVVGGAPRHPERLGGAGDGQVLHHDRLQRPPQPTAGQLGSWLGGLAGVLPPD